MCGQLGSVGLIRGGNGQLVVVIFKDLRRKLPEVRGQLFGYWQDGYAGYRLFRDRDCEFEFLLSAI